MKTNHIFALMGLLFAALAAAFLPLASPVFYQGVLGGLAFALIQFLPRVQTPWATAGCDDPTSEVLSKLTKDLGDATANLNKAHA